MASHRGGGDQLAGKAEPKAVRDALWKVNVLGVNGPIEFEKDGPAGKESGQSKPSIFIAEDWQDAQTAFAARMEAGPAPPAPAERLLLGGTYSLLGIGLTLVFGLMNVVNFAHGEFYTLGAY